MMGKCLAFDLEKLVGLYADLGFDLRWNCRLKLARFKLAFTRSKAFRARDFQPGNFGPMGLLYIALDLALDLRNSRFRLLFARALKPRLGDTPG